MPLTSREPPVRIPLPVAGEWIDVKPRRSKADETALYRRMLGNVEISPLQAASFDGRSQAEVAAELLGETRLSAADLIEDMTWAGIETAIVGWSFYEGQPKPEDIRDLDEASYDAIVAGLNELYPPPRSDDDRKNSASAGATPSLGEAASLESSPG